VTTREAIHAFLIVGFGVAAVVLPGLILRYRRSAATYALCGMVWLVFTAGILAIRRDLLEHSPLDVVDAIRLGALACFLVFVLAYDRGGRNGRR
jgi:hypothetical protein